MPLWGALLPPPTHTNIAPVTIPITVTPIPAEIPAHLDDSEGTFFFFCGNLSDISIVHVDGPSAAGPSTLPPTPKLSSSNPSAASAPQPELNWSLFPLINKEFEEGKWLDEVVWGDDGARVAADKVIPLILDLNDKYLIRFETTSFL